MNVDRRWVLVLSAMGIVLGFGEFWLLAQAAAPGACRQQVTEVLSSCAAPPAPIVIVVAAVVAIGSAIAFGAALAGAWRSADK